MKNQWSVALVVEGNATGSSVLRLPNLADELGPIKATALRVARRVSNFLRAGFAVNSYEELKSSRIILLHVPDAAIRRIMDEICASDLALKDVCVVFCETLLNASVLQPLHSRGASTATLMPFSGTSDNWFVLEGQLAAVRQMKRFLDRNNARAFEIRAGAKPLYFAALLLATALPLPLLANAQLALRTAGISGNHLHELLEGLSTEMFRSFANGARLSWPPHRKGYDAKLARQYLEQLRIEHPEIAEVIDAHLPSDGKALRKV